MSEKVTTKIHFQFLPYLPESNLHAVEKSGEGKKPKRYLTGVSSGIAVDGHGERMTSKAIESFLAQSMSREILLYPDVHGIQASNDIGRLVKTEIMDNGDWYTEYELYDGSEGAQPYQVERANTLWNQVKGLAPYKKSRQFGFSIEGIVPEDGFSMDDKGRRMMNDVELDGVVLVPKPAYTTSVAAAVYKALGEKQPTDFKRGLLETFGEKVSEKEAREKYYSISWDYRSALEDCICAVMENPDIDITAKKTYLEDVLTEYKTRLIDLVLQSESVFRKEESSGATATKSIWDDGGATTDVEKTFRALTEQVKRLHKSLKENT